MARKLNFRATVEGNDVSYMAINAEEATKVVSEHIKAGNEGNPDINTCVNYRTVFVPSNDKFNESKTYISQFRHKYDDEAVAILAVTPKKGTYAMPLEQFMKLARQQKDYKRGMINRKGASTAYIYDYLDLHNPTAGVQHSEAIACDKNTAGLPLDKLLAKVRKLYEDPTAKIITGVRMHRGEECYNWITPEELFKYGVLLSDEEAKKQEEEEAQEAEAEAQEEAEAEAQEG